MNFPVFNIDIKPELPGDFCRYIIFLLHSWKSSNIPIIMNSDRDREANGTTAKSVVFRRWDLAALMRSTSDVRVVLQTMPAIEHLF